MDIQETKKAFTEPQCEIVCFATEDILESSSLNPTYDWGLGDF